VYPAAGLVQYAPHAADKYIIDKKIPYLTEMPGLTVIEKPATEGISDLLEHLKKGLN
jgi:NAD-dependent deacetylase